MNRVFRTIAIGTVILSAALLSFWGLRRMLASGVQERLRGSEPFGIRLTVTEGKETLALAQLVIFPDKNQALLAFINTDARFSQTGDPVARLSPASGDRFERFTGVSTDYSVQVSRTDLARLIDVAGGIPFFLEEPVFFKDALFQYPQGLELFSGAQLLEYAFGGLITKDKDVIFSSVDRVYRTESAVLSMVWRLERLRAAFAQTQMVEFAVSLLRTDLKPVELSALLTFLTDDAFTAVLEVPLETGPKRTRDNPDFLVKEDSARKLFGEFKDRLSGGTLRRETYPVDLLNGTERKGLANRVKHLLKDQGPLVLAVSNYEPKPVEHSLVLDRIGNTFGAASFARKTGVKKERVFFLRRSAQVNLSLLIGNDFAMQQIEL